MTDETAIIGAVFQRRAEGEDFDLLLDLGDARRRNQIGFGNHEDRHLDAEQVDDVEVLLGLRHDAVVGGDGEEHEIDAVRAGEHVPDEALVAGDVDDAARVPSGRSRWAKPRSMEMPRSFSSLSRSVSVPVSALTRLVLP